MIIQKLEGKSYGVRLKDLDVDLGNERELYWAAEDNETTDSLSVCLVYELPDNSACQ